MDEHTSYELGQAYRSCCALLDHLTAAGWFGSDVALRAEAIRKELAEVAFNDR